jgi:hypothetical protein
MLNINEEFLITLKKNRYGSYVCNDISTWFSNGRLEYFKDLESIQLIDGNIHYTIRGKSKVELIKPGRFLNKFWGGKWNDRDIEIFSNICASKQKIGEVLEVVEGNKIPFYYSEYNYSIQEGKVGTLWKSCMRQEEKQKYFKIYTNNSKNCKLLTLTFDGYVQARAILWYGVIDEKGDTYNLMDRIYSIKDSQVQLFKNWAFDNNFFCKIEQSHKDGRFINSEGVILEKKLFLPFAWENYDRYPYFDTFRFLDEGKNLLSNHSNKKVVHLFQSTKGQILRGVFDVWNKEYINMEKSVQTYKGDYINAKSAIRSEWFGFNGTPDDFIWSDKYKWIPKENSEWSEFYETYIIKDNSVFSKPLNSYIPKEESIIIGNDYWDKSMVYFSKTYNQYLLKRDSINAYCYSTNGTFIDFILKTDVIKIGDKFFKLSDCKKINDRFYFVGHLGRDGKVSSEYEWVYYGNEETIKMINNYSDLKYYATKSENKKIPSSKRSTKKSKSTLNTIELLRPRIVNRERDNFLEDEEN